MWLGLRSMRIGWQPAVCSRVFEAARQACRQHLLSRINVMQRDDSKFRTRHAGKLWIEG
jgi:hypothetical protein